MTKTGNVLFEPSNILWAKLAKPLKPLFLALNKIKRIFFIVLGCLLSALLWQWQSDSHQRDLFLSSAKLIKQPMINDVYFLDFRLISDIRRPKQNYRVAKVFDVTGDTVTLCYSELLFEHKRGAVNSVRYGHLRYKEYFQSPRFNLTKQQLNTWLDTGAIYQVKRPVAGKLYGNYVSPHKPYYRVPPHMPGKREYLQGIAFLGLKYDELADAKAFDYIKKSAFLGAVEGQIKLAEMYLSGLGTAQNKMQSLHWFEQAALQGSERAVHKYAIVCQQVVTCNTYDFYQSLKDAGINIKISNGQSRF